MVRGCLDKPAISAHLATSVYVAGLFCCLYKPELNVDQSGASKNSVPDGTHYLPLLWTISRDENKHQIPPDINTHGDKITILCKIWIKPRGKTTPLNVNGRNFLTEL